MEAFQIVNGDLAIGPGGFAMVSGVEKVFQDLSIAIREPFGIDRFHSRWGSQVGDYVGLPANEHAKMLIQSEVTRIVRNYMAAQQGYLQADGVAGQKPRFGTNEIVIDIHDIQIVQTYDAFHVKVILVTQSGDQVTIVRTVTS
jgi:hypothetical protein